MSLLQKFINFSYTESTHLKPGLERIYQACEQFGHPERKFRSIHIAGTNGKGSVTALMQSILTEAGYKTGRFTSPHLIDVKERFCVDGELISEKNLENILEKIVEKEIFVPERESKLTFFELCTLIAFIYFAELKVDWGVIETGLGGRLDSTNILFPEISIITEIDYDHTEILGTTIEQISTEKAGIIKYRTPLICGATDPVAKETIQKIAEEKEAPIFYPDPPHSLLGNFFNCGKFKKLSVALKGEHQKQNTAIALKGIETLSTGKTPISEVFVREGLARVKWFGRLEQISDSPPIILDGAHNESGIRSLTAFLENFPDIKWKVLFSGLQGKNIDQMVALLNPFVSFWGVCPIDHPKAISMEQLSQKVQKTEKEMKVFLNSSEGYRFLSELLAESLVESSEKKEGILITGSLYLVGEIKRLLAS